MENITEKQKEIIEKTLNRAIEQGKIENKSDATIKVNKQKNVWLSWENKNRSFRFTIFEGGEIHCGLFGTE